MFDVAGFQFLLDKDLFGETGNIKIDMTYYGFSVDSEKPVGGGAGCSPGACSSGSCAC